jgi:nitric oxide reductase subunit C
LKWVGEIDTNDWPPKPDIEYKPLQASISPSISDSKQPEKFSQLCIACHAVGGKGGLVGPSLDKVGSKYDKTYLLKWLSDPQSIKPGTAMPKLPLSESEVNEVADYLLTLK